MAKWWCSKQLLPTACAFAGRPSVRAWNSSGACRARFELRAGRAQIVGGRQSGRCECVVWNRTARFRSKLALRPLIQTALPGGESPFSGRRRVRDSLVQLLHHPHKHSRQFCRLMPADWGLIAVSFRSVVMMGVRDQFRLWWTYRAACSWSPGWAARASPRPSGCRPAASRARP